MQETESMKGYRDEEEGFVNPRSRLVSGYRGRRIKDRILTVLAVATVLIALYPLVSILAMFAYRGALALSVPRITQTTLSGGLANALVGTLLLVGLSALIAVPLGVLGGVYLAEFSGTSRLSGLTRFVSDVLSAMPSILLGYVGYLVLVLYFGWGFSALAGGVTLAILMLPYILRTTERSLRKVPTSLREGAVALGSRKTHVVNRLALRLAAPGILTGILLSLSISLGETAPLLYTASFSDLYPCGLTRCGVGVGYLNYVVYIFTNTSSHVVPDADNLAYLAVFLLLGFTVAINLVARIGLRRLSKI